MEDPPDEARESAADLGFRVEPGGNVPTTDEPTVRVLSCYLRILRDARGWTADTGGDEKDEQELSGETEIRLFPERKPGECEWELLVNARGSRVHNSDDARAVAEDIRENAGDRQLGEDPCALVVLTGGAVPPGETVSIEWKRKIPRAAAAQYAVDNYDIENEDELRDQFGR